MQKNLQKDFSVRQGAIQTPSFGSWNTNRRDFRKQNPMISTNVVPFLRSFLGVGAGSFWRLLSKLLIAGRCDFMVNHLQDENVTNTETCCRYNQNRYTVYIETHKTILDVKCVLCHSRKWQIYGILQNTSVYLLFGFVRRTLELDWSIKSCLDLIVMLGKSSKHIQMVVQNGSKWWLLW